VLSPKKYTSAHKAHKPHLFSVFFFWKMLFGQQQRSTPELRLTAVVPAAELRRPTVVHQKFSGEKWWLTAAGAVAAGAPVVVSAVVAGAPAVVDF
jgi:hypothetical protein